ncbi:antibiotic biosynthesis monooxygenase [Maridesulfovibrio sp.]|uniref:antibiotic biosynthesis monooxygenase family protein n=1 Tax=Maridesulfovibrio sp. TaxID=2795000 RepID=UPI002A18B5E6|nr:antibiotic biosynthesis monooxygenase [Maridesulfovibrio sp.]
MYAVIFEVYPKTDGKQEYFEIATRVRSFLENREGFISIERFQSLNDEEKILSLSFWEDEDAIEKWRNLLDHREAQQTGLDNLFKSYRIRIGKITIDYTDNQRNLAPKDSNEYLFS